MTTETDFGPAWQEFISAISAAWPGEILHWSESPLELLTRLIDERDEATKVIGDWAVTRWNEEVRDRPQENIYRRVLDQTWRQVIRRCGVPDPSGDGGEGRVRSVSVQPWDRPA